MKQYIDKATLVEKINKRIQDASIDCYGHQRVWAYNDIKNIIDTIEVKEDVLLDNACEWIKQHIEDEKYKIPDEESYRHGLHYDYFETNMFINDFCKAMTNEKKS